MRNESWRSSNVAVIGEDEIHSKAVEVILESARSCIDAKGSFSIALSGGTTPKRLYEKIARDYASTLDWSRILIFFSDERCVPPDDPDSNFRMVNETLLSTIDIPPGNIHRMRGEIEPGEAAAEYTEELRRFGNSSGVPKLDLVLLGMGEDGHTASLFPGSEAINETFVPVVSQYVPKLGSHRLTLTPPVLLKARSVLFLVTGESKSKALKQVLEGPYDPDQFPAQILRTADGDVTWYVDPPAARLLETS